VGLRVERLMRREREKGGECCKDCKGKRERWERGEQGFL